MLVIRVLMVQTATFQVQFDTSKLIYSACGLISKHFVFMCEDAELEASVNMAADIMCQYARDSEEIALMGESATDYSVMDTWLSFLQVLVDEPFRLSMTGASCSISVMQGLLKMHNVYNIDLDRSRMTLLLDGVDAILRYEQYFRPEGHSNEDRYNLVRSVSHLFLSYCEVLTDVNSTITDLGTPSYESKQNRLAIAAVVWRPDFDTVTDVTFSHGPFYISIVTLHQGPYCLIGYDAEVYESRMTAMLEMGVLTVVPFNITENGTGTHHRHIVVDLSVVPDRASRLDSFNVTCGGDGNATAVLCMNYTQYEVSCGEVGVWSFFCPNDTSVNLTCTRERNSTSDYSEVCEVDYLTNDTVSCTCSKMLPVAYGERVVDVEFDFAMLVVCADFLETISTIQSISDDDVLHGAKSLVFMAVILIFLCGVLIYVDIVAERQAQEALLGKARPKTSLKVISQADTEAVDFATRYTDVDGMLPEMYRDDAFFQLFITEVKNSHRWISICFRYDAEFPRYLKLLFLVSVVNCMLFFNALLFNLIVFDSRSCGQFDTIATCLSAPSKFASLQTMCYWNEEGDVYNSTVSGHCFSTIPSSSGNLILTITAISVFLSIPVMMLLESIVVHLLCRPVLTPKQVAPTSLLNENINMKVGSNCEKFGGGVNLCCTKAHNVGVEVNDDILRDVNTDIRQLVFDLQQHRLKLKKKAAADFDSRWGFTQLQIEEFLREIENYMSGVNEHEVVVKRQHRLMEVAHAICGWFSFLTENTRAPPFKEKGFRRLWNDILEVRLKAAVEIALIESMPLNDLKGDRMLLLFKYDLLQGILSQVVAKLYIHRILSRMSSTLSRAYIQNRVHLSKGFRFLGCMLLMMLNAFFLLYIFLFLLRQRNTGYGDEWLKGFAMWVAVDILLISTLSVILGHIFPLGVAFKGMEQANKVFRDILVRVFSDRVDRVDPLVNYDRINSSGEIVRHTERASALLQEVEGCEKPFNISPYFFVSWRVAKAFPHLIESKAIDYFRSVVPNTPYSRGRRPLHDIRVKYRLAVIAQNLAMVIAYSLMALITAIPSLEYYVFSILGWLIFGFLGRKSGFTVLGAHVKFTGYFLIGFVIIFYLCIFFVGRRIFQIVHTEYKVGRNNVPRKNEKLHKATKKVLQTIKMSNLLKGSAVKPSEEASHVDTSHICQLPAVDETIERSNQFNIFELLNNGDDMQVDVLDGDNISEMSCSSPVSDSEFGRIDDELVAIRAARFLRDKGVHVEAKLSDKDCISLAEAVKTAFSSTSVPNRRTISCDNESGSDYDSSDDYTQEDIILAYQYLSEIGISLGEKTKMSIYVKLAKLVEFSQLDSEV